MQTNNELLERVLARIGTPSVTSFRFDSWDVPGKPTAEGVGLLPVPGIDAEKLLARVMDLDHYVGPIPHVVESRSIADPRFQPPAQVRFYQRIKVPLIGELHQESVIARLPARNGFELAAWRLLDKETEALSPKSAIRAAYSDGVWLVAPGVVGYALSAAPRRDDVGFLKWKALTAGADATASKVIRDNIAAMARWAGASV
jgi:hypothetical protein